jgi:hypothetical protein
LLSAPDRKRFEQMIEIHHDNGPVMSARLDAQIAAAGGARSRPPSPADRAKQAARPSIRRCSSSMQGRA